jgi:hypothetical protein
MDTETPRTYWQVGSSTRHGVTEVRCLAGQQTEPRRCTRHPEHFWCTTCEGYYGVPHDEFTHGKWAGSHRGFGTCVCRPCRELDALHLVGDARRDALTAHGSAWHPEFPAAPQLA